MEPSADDKSHHRLSRQETKKRLWEYLRVRPVLPTDPAGLLETALFVEDAFGVSLTDDDIHPETLGSAEALSEFLERRQER